jgi:hypothetical protein
MRGGSRNAIAKKRTPIDSAKIKMYATLSMSKAPAYPVSNNSLPSYMSKMMMVIRIKNEVKVVKNLPFWATCFFILHPSYFILHLTILNISLQNVRELPSGELICHPLFGTDPIRPVLLGRRPHQQIHLGRLSESRAKCDRRRITERNKRVQR